MKNITNKYMKASQTLLKHLNQDSTPENVFYNFSHDYLTINDGSDNNSYVWYLDTVNNAIIDIETLNIITDEETINKIFNL